jgi:hypothetical protein
MFYGNLKLLQFYNGHCWCRKQITFRVTCCNVSSLPKHTSANSDRALRCVKSIPFSVSSKVSNGETKFTLMSVCDWENLLSNFQIHIHTGCLNAMKSHTTNPSDKWQSTNWLANLIMMHSEKFIKIMIICKNKYFIHLCNGDTKLIKPRSMWQEGQVACMGEKRNVCKV